MMSSKTLDFVSCHSITFSLIPWTHGHNMPPQDQTSLLHGRHKEVGEGEEERVTPTTTVPLLRKKSFPRTLAGNLCLCHIGQIRVSGPVPAVVGGGKILGISRLSRGRLRMEKTEGNTF